MTEDKLKQYVALFGGWLSAILFFLGTLGLSFDWFTVDSISAFVVVLTASVPFALLLFGVWKNTYFSKKAKEQEKLLQRNELK